MHLCCANPLLANSRSFRFLVVLQRQPFRPLTDFVFVACGFSAEREEPLLSFGAARSPESDDNMAEPVPESPTLRRSLSQPMMKLQGNRKEDVR
jgi:hypothetical protein